MTGLVTLIRRAFAKTHTAPPPPHVKPVTEFDRKVIDAKDRVVRARLQLLRSEVEVPALWQMDKRKH